MVAREVVALLRVVCALSLARPAAGDAWWRTQRIPGLWLLATPYVAAWEPAVLAHYLPWYTTGTSATESASGHAVPSRRRVGGGQLTRVAGGGRAQFAPRRVRFSRL